MYVYESASGELCQHTTSMHRLLALARTHPIVQTVIPIHLRNLRLDREVDDEGRATKGHQSEFDLSLSLAGSGCVFIVGLSRRNVHPDLFALHWRPKGSGWTMNARMAARMLFFDLVELDANHFLLLSVPLLPALRRPTLAPAPVAASGAVKEGPRNLVSLSDEEDEEQDLGAEEDASTESSVWLGAEEDTSTEGSDSYESSESCGDEGGEDEESGRAATGALRGVLRPSEIDEMSEDEKANVLRRVVGAHRQVHFRDADWPEESIMWLCSIDLVQKRRRRLSRLIDILKKQCSPLPSEQEFMTGIAHLSDNRMQAGMLYPVVRALSTHKMHYLAKLKKLFRDVAITDDKRFFCVAFPNLQPASGGERVEYLDHAHPAWDLMEEKWGVRTVPEFLKHLFAKHNGEARLIGDFSWIRMREDVCNPEFWSYQFARTENTRAWLASRKDPDERMLLKNVHWILDESDGRTLLIRRGHADGVAQFYIRSGTVVTLPEMMFWGEGLCTCYDVYKLYVDLPIVIKKREHSGTQRNRKKARTS